MAKTPMTKSSFQILEKELKYLKSVERQSIINDIATARALGDLSENAEYHAAREKQAFVESRIGELENKLSGSHVIDVTKLSGKIVKFGATVSIIEEVTKVKKRYHIVGEDEADLSKNKLSFLSPISRSLIGRKVGDIIDVNGPGGVNYYEIVFLEYKEF